MSAGNISRKIRNMLRELTSRVVELDYPANYRERSIDFVASLEEYYRERPRRPLGSMVIRVSPGKVSVSSEVEEDLAKFADAVDGVPVVVSDELYDNIVFDHGEVFLSNERTLENLVKERELIALYRRNELYVALNVELIEKELRRGSLRLSELSNTLGLSKKSVESCLKGLGLINIDKAEKLVTELGPEMVLSINYETLRELFKRKQSQAAESGQEPRRTLIYELNKTAVDLVIRGATSDESGSLKFYVDYARTKSVKTVKAKVANALRLAREFRAVVEVVVPDISQLEVVKREVSSELQDSAEPYIRFSFPSRSHVFQRSSG
jgi:predicted transcriptional regulator